MSSKIAVVVVVILIGIFGFFMFVDSYGTGSEATGLVVSEESFPTYLETHPVIESLPDGAAVEIDIGEVVYNVEGKNVYVGADDKQKDIKVTLPEGYEDVIGNVGLCKALNKAYREDKIKVETYASKLSLLFKYRKLLKYGDCLN